MIDYLSRFEGAAAEFRAALSSTDVAASVPGCPGWTVHDVAAHITGGERWAASVVLSGIEQHRYKGAIQFGTLPEWYANAAAATAAALRAVAPDEPCWNFSPVDHRAGFWRRRRLHETLVHLVDVQQAAGRQPAIDGELAADGVDEVFGVFLPRLLMRGFPPAVTRPLTIAATDTGHAWTLVPADDPATAAPEVRRDAADGLATISGTAAELYLAAWNRLGRDRLEITGDELVGREFLAATLTP